MIVLSQATPSLSRSNTCAKRHPKTAFKILKG
jgi:hypothetical protein